MSEQSPQKLKIPFLLIFGIGLVFFLFWYAVQDHIGIKFIIPYIVGYCISIGGILHISLKVYLVDKKPFTDCNEITPKDLSRLMFFIVIVGLSISFRTPNPSETAILTRTEIQFLILLTNILISIGAIRLMVANKTTRETLIVLSLSVIYFWSGFYVYDIQLGNLLFSILNAISLVTLMVGIQMLGQQKDKKDIFQEQVEKLQKTRKTAKDLQTTLSESEFAKIISQLSDVPLTEAPPPKIAWDVDYDVRKAKENQYIAKQLKQQIDHLKQLKDREPTDNEKIILSSIDQAKKLLETLKQHISQLEKPRMSTQRTTGHSNSGGDSIGQLQQNAPVTLDRVNALLGQIQTIIQQQKDKIQTQYKQDFEQALNKLKSDVDHLGGIKKL
jgi:hypothetical protein